MMPSALTQRLAWKSFRQSIALVVTLIVLAAIVSSIAANFSRGYAWDVVRPLAALVPILFAVGAGSVLVSLDRDTKAMDWLKSLPVRWYQIVFTPIAVAMIALVSLWILVYLFGIYTIVLFGGNVRDLWGSETLYITFHSCYVLLCGFASAWIFRSPLPALLGIVPLAAIPALLEFGRQAVSRWWHDSPSVRYIPDLPMPLAIGLLGVCGLGMVVATAVLSRAALLPQKHTSTQHGLVSSLRAALQHAFDFADSFRTGAVQPVVPMRRMSTLLWGFYYENRGIFIAGQFAVFALAGSLVLFSQTTRFDRAQLAAAIVAWLSGILLLTIPVVTFQADANRDRVRFLTERGVRPKELWWSRQLVTFGITSLFLVVIMLMGIVAPTVINVTFSAVDSWAMLLVLVFHAHAVSQWIGQVIHRVTIAIFISLVAVIFSSGLILNTKPPLWSVVIADTLLMLATYRMMQPWMERRIDWRYWLGHARYGAIVIVLLLWPWGLIRRNIEMVYHNFGYTPSTWKWVSWRSDWELEASAAFHEAPPETALVVQLHELDPADWQTNKTRMQNEDPQQRVEAKLSLLKEAARFQREELYDKLESQLGSGGIHFRAIWDGPHLVSLAEKLRLNALHFETGDSDLGPEERYVRWVQLMVRITAGLRQSHHLSSQEIADQYEIWLIKQCLEMETSRLIDNVTFDAICDLVGDPEKRWDSRRRALLVSERRRRRGDLTVSYSHPFTRNNRSIVPPIGTLIEYIEAAKLGRADYPAETLRDASGELPEHFGIGVGADWVRVDDARKHGFLLGVPTPVAMLWGAGWEQQAQQLRQLSGNTESALQETEQ